jgi:hypothetical protein
MPGIAVVISAVQTVTQVIQTVMGVLSGAVNAIKAVIGTILNVLGRLFSAVVSAVERIAGATAAAVSWLGQLAATATKVGLVVGGVLATALGYAGVKAFDTSKQFEVMRKTLDTVMRSPFAGGQMMAWAEQFAATTPFEVDQVVMATARLQAYGIAAQHWLPLIGDMSAAMGKDAMMGVEAVADAYMGEMERLKEFGMRGDMLIAYGANKASGGGVSAKTEEDRRAILEAMERIITERYSGAMVGQMSIGEGIISNMRDAVTRIRRDVGDRLMIVFKQFAPYFSQWLETARNVIGPVASALAGFANLMGRAAANLIPEALSRGGDLWNALMIALQRVAPHIANIGEQARVVFGWLLDKVVGFLPDGIEGLGRAFSWVADRVVEALPAIEGFFTQAWDIVQQLAPAIKDAFASMGGGFWGGLQGFLANLPALIPQLQAYIRNVGELLGNFMSVTLPWVGQTLVMAFAGINTLITNMNSNMPAMVQAFNDTISALGSVVTLFAAIVLSLAPLLAVLGLLTPAEAGNIMAQGTIAAGTLRNISQNPMTWTPWQQLDVPELPSMPAMPAAPAGGRRSRSGRRGRGGGDDDVAGIPLMEPNPGGRNVSVGSGLPSLPSYWQESPRMSRRAREDFARGQTRGSGHRRGRSR